MMSQQQAINNSINNPAAAMTMNSQSNSAQMASQQAQQRRRNLKAPNFQSGSMTGLTTNANNAGMVCIGAHGQQP